MYSEKNFQFYIKQLTSENPEEKGRAVGRLTAIDVEGDERLLPLLEPLLQDERIVRMPAAPISYPSSVRLRKLLSFTKSRAFAKKRIGRFFSNNKNQI